MRLKLGKLIKNKITKNISLLSILEVAKSGQIAEYFDQRGYACVEKSNITEEKATELAIEINAEEVIEAIDDDGEREVWKVSLNVVFFSVLFKTIKNFSSSVHQHFLDK